MNDVPKINNSWQIVRSSQTWQAKQIKTTQWLVDYGNWNTDDELRRNVHLSCLRLIGSSVSLEASGRYNNICTITVRVLKNAFTRWQNTWEIRRNFRSRLTRPVTATISNECSRWFFEGSGSKSWQVKSGPDVFNPVNSNYRRIRWLPAVGDPDNLK